MIINPITGITDVIPVVEVVVKFLVNVIGIRV